jgi:hypothetical protein
MMIQQVRHASTEPSTGLHITSSLGLVLALVPYPTSVVRPFAGDSAQHNPLRHTAATPEGDPPRVLIAGHPRPLEAAFLVEGHDVTHTGTVA